MSSITTDTWWLIGGMLLLLIVLLVLIYRNGDNSKLYEHNSGDGMPEKQGRKKEGRQ